MEPRKPHELDKQYPKADYIPVGVVNLEFELEATETGETMVTAKYRVRRNDDVADDTPLVLDLASEVELLSVKINGWVMKTERVAETVVVRGVPSEFNVETVTFVNTKDNTTCAGLYQAGDLFLTQNEPEGFRKILPYFDCPKVLAPFRTTVIGNKEKFPVMLSNGNLVEEREQNGRHVKVYNLPFPIPSYLFALVAGKLEVLEDKYVTMSGRTVNLGIYADAKDIEKCHHAMASLKHAMKYDEDWYGYECDVNDYKIVATPYFNFGAMENKGLNIFNVSCVLASPETATDANFERVEGVVAHEYFHNWTGDRITCVDWRELGTKESITVRRDSLFSSDYRGWGLRKEIGNALDMRSRQFAEDAGPNRHAIRPAEIKEPNNMYTATVYVKGAEVYKMLEDIIGRDGFLKGMKLYAKRHDGQATRIEDLMRCMEDANGVDLYQFRNWFTQSGTPTVSVDYYSYSEHSKKLLLDISQTCTMAPDRTKMEPFDIPFVIGLIGPDGEMCSKTLRITKPEETFIFTDVPHKPALSLNRNFAPVKVKYDYREGELAQLMAHDTSLFARWDASQTYSSQVLLKLAEDVKAGRKLVLDKAFIDAFGSVLKEEGIDANLLAEMMTLPSETTLANMSDVVDPHAIHTARKFAKKALDDAYRVEFYFVWCGYCEDWNNPISFDPESVARRSVANIALSYLVSDSVWKNVERYLFGEFEKAKGMSDKYTALSILVAHSDKPKFGPFAEKALVSFYEQYKDDNNVIDMWFSVQAYSDKKSAISLVKDLMEHPSFDLNNPNRVRSLLSAFSRGSVQFHTEEGYRLLADFLAEYAPKNDIVAAGLVSQLAEWKRYTPVLQIMMKSELLRLKETLLKVPAEKVRGTMEKIEKSLAQ